jgi:hypothetical protein
MSNILPANSAQKSRAQQQRFSLVMKLAIMIFILLASLVIVGGHAYIFFSLVKFFVITSVKAKWWLGSILGVLSISFIITSLLVHSVETVYTDTIYAGASGWLGIVWHIAIAVTITWALFGLSNLIKVNLPLRATAIFLLAIAFGFSVYSLWNAFNPVVTRITVRLPNLPASWKGRTAVQMSDIHLGPVHRQLFLKKLVLMAQKENPDIVFITGDLFDGGGSDVSSLPLGLNELQPKLGTYFISGNHEFLLGINKSLDAVGKTNVHILLDEVVEVDGVNIAGFDYMNRPNEQLINRILANRPQGKPTIVLYHVPILRDLFKNAGVNLQLSGHTHKGQMWPFGFITNLVYQGKDIGFHTDGDYNIFTSSGAGTWGPPMRTGNRPEIVAITFE